LHRADLRAKSMKYAIIAAGEGSRLAAEGITDPKPLVRVHGERLIDRLLRIFAENGADEVVVICNDRMPRVMAHLKQRQKTFEAECGVPLRLVIKSTPGSMHSFFALSEYLRDDAFVLTTVDTIFDERAFADYVSAFKNSAAKGIGMFPVTDFIDDERPLYVGVDDEMNITGFHDESNGCRYISAGIYGLLPEACRVLDDCMAQGKTRMRQFQRALVAEGFPLKAFPMRKVLDIDHATDIEKAERFLESGAWRTDSDSENAGKGKSVLMIQRAERFSPNAVEKDKRILTAVGNRLAADGWRVSYQKEEDVEATGSLPFTPDVVFTMARSASVLSVLQAAEDRGVRVINSVASVRMCNSRSETDRVMRRNGLPVAPLYISGAGWAKSDCGHDVRFAADEQTMRTYLKAMPGAVATAHIEGREVKFYGVRDRFFFPSEADEALKNAAQRVAELTGTTIFGGDAVVREDGTFAIIDFNDWPSFSPCCEEAAEAISKTLGTE